MVRHKKFKLCKRAAVPGGREGGDLISPMLRLCIYCSSSS